MGDIFFYFLVKSNVSFSEGTQNHNRVSYSTKPNYDVYLAID
jgi:hypothetical protein